jgi:hypothetical protein
MQPYPAKVKACADLIPAPLCGTLIHDIEEWVSRMFAK